MNSYNIHNVHVLGVNSPHESVQIRNDGVSKLGEHTLFICNTGNVFMYDKTNAHCIIMSPKVVSK